MQISSASLKNSFKNIMDTMFPPSEKVAIGVAVSGGGDSMALLCLAYEWFAKYREGRIHAFTVDHGLRAESKDEALWVGSFLKRHAIPHTILQATHNFSSFPYHQKSLQAEARKMRYDLLFNACHHYNLSHLLFGHHKQDQAETFFDHLFRGSGIEGLCGMNMVRTERKVMVLRPLLKHDSQALKNLLKEEAWEYVSDPSNEDRLYQRVRIRTWLAQENPAQLSSELLVDRIVKTTEHMQRAKKCVNFYLKQEIRKHNLLSSFGYSRLNWYAIETLPKEMIYRLLMYNIWYIKGKKEPFRFENIDNLHDKLLETQFKGTTLHGCYIQKKGEFLFFYREKSKITPKETLNFNKSLLWDGRFSIILKSKAIKSGWVQSFDDTCWQKLIAQKRLPLELPKEALYGLPVFYNNNTSFIAIPHLDFYEDVEWKEAIEITYHLYEE